MDQVRVFIRLCFYVSFFPCILSRISLKKLEQIPRNYFFIGFHFLFGFLGSFFFYVWYFLIFNFALTSWCWSRRWWECLLSLFFENVLRSRNPFTLLLFIAIIVMMFLILNIARGDYDDEGREARIHFVCLNWRRNPSERRHLVMTYFSWISCL